MKTSSLEAPGHKIQCEVFKIECHVSDEERKPQMRLGDVEVYVPVDPSDVTPDVLVGRSILNRMTMELNGAYLNLRR